MSAQVNTARVTLELLKVVPPQWLRGKDTPKLRATLAGPLLEIMYPHLAAALEGQNA